MSGVVVDSAELSFVVVADSLATQKNVMFLGDSLTANGIYTAEVTKVLNANLVSVGTIERQCTIGNTSYTVLHEGRAGWSAQEYVSPSEKTGGATNAFWNPSTSKFDFAYYMTESGVSAPAIVCIGLGTNGMSNPTAETAAIEEIITSIHAYNSNILCLVSLITPPATQNGTGRSNGLQSSKGLKRGELRLNQHYLTAFEGRNDNVDVYELYFNLDCENDFATVTIPLSSRNPGTWVCQNNNVHPNEYGYLKFADVIYANLLYHLG
jgi:hypothetical protein